MAIQRTLQQLSEWLGAGMQGDPGLVISGVGSLDQAGPGQISFFSNKKYADMLTTTRAEVVILPSGVSYPRPALISKNPYLDFAKVLGLFAPAIPLPAPGIHPQAAVHPDAKIGREVAIGPFCVVGAKAVVGDRTVLAAQVFVGEETVIGADCRLYAGVVLRERVSLGDRVIIHPNAVIGADGFGFAPAGDHYVKIPQIGTVVIEDDVEIGANTTIDRAALGETRVGRGAKLDNLVMIAHNVSVGAGTVIAAQAGISGSTRVGSQVMIGGQAGIAGHMQIGNRAILGAQAGMTRDVPEGEFVSGYPARPHAESMRQLAGLARLPELVKKIRLLEARVKELEGQ